MADEPGTVTQLLAAARAGDAGAVDRLFTLLYPDLRRIARARMRDTDERVVLDTTALLHECYLRLVKLRQLDADSRSHFLAYAARAMRSVVIDIARERHAARRGGELCFVTLDTAAADGARDTDAAELIALNDALDELAAVDRRLVTIVEMRYFGGFSNGEIADALGVGLRTVERDWERARSFLYASLRDA